MKDKIPTAEVILEYLIPNAKNEMTGLQYTNALEAIRSHGKHYVEAALMEAAKRIKLKGGNVSDCQAILNSYPLSNIK